MSKKRELVGELHVTLQVAKHSEPEHKVNESVGKHKSFECENQLKHNSE